MRKPQSSILLLDCLLLSCLHLNNKEEPFCTRVPLFKENINLAGCHLVELLNGKMDAFTLKVVICLPSF